MKCEGPAIVLAGPFAFLTSSPALAELPFHRFSAVPTRRTP